jgi:hypothetical protein
VPEEGVPDDYDDATGQAVAAAARLAEDPETAPDTPPHGPALPAGRLRRAAPGRGGGATCLLWTVSSPALIRKYAADPRIAIITDVAAQAVSIVKGDGTGH